MRTSPLLAAMLLAATGVAAGQGTEVPVYVGDLPDAACADWGEVGGTAALTVRGGPGPEFAAIGRLASGHRVHLCDASGDWLGVVYSPGGGQSDCGVSAPVTDKQPYMGPCRSGWVHRKFVRVAPREA